LYHEPVYTLNEAFLIYSAIVESKDMAIIENQHQQERTFRSSPINFCDPRKSVPCGSLYPWSLNLQQGDSKDFLGCMTTILKLFKVCRCNNGQKQIPMHF